MKLLQISQRDTLDQSYHITKIPGVLVLINQL